MSCRVLVVEDETVIAMLVEDLLENSGCLPIVAGSNAEARSAIERGPAFDLAIIDLHLPDGNGLTAISALWSRWPVPVIISTGYQDVPEEFSDALSPFPAPLEAISKPWNEDHFLSLVRRLLPQAEVQEC